VESPLGGSANQPRNLMSGKEYKGINVLLLGCTGYTSPYFLTFNQANKVGAHVRKGVGRGYPVVFWKFGVSTLSACQSTGLFNSRESY
jgi:antirestriction protein ArdC